MIGGILLLVSPWIYRIVQSKYSQYVQNKKWAKAVEDYKNTGKEGSDVKMLKGVVQDSNAMSLVDGGAQTVVFRRNFHFLSSLSMTKQ